MCLWFQIEYRKNSLQDRRNVLGLRDRKSERWMENGYGYA